MPLSAELTKVAQEYAAKAEAGDAQAIRFWADINSRIDAIAEDWKAAVKVQFEVKAGGVSLDPAKIKGLQLQPHQLKDGKRMAEKYIAGDADAIAFYNGCEAGKAAGSMASAAMLMLRDEYIRATKASPKVVRDAAEEATQKGGASPSGVAPMNPPIPVGESSGLVVTLPPLNNAGMAVIRGAIANHKIFNAECVKLLVDEIESLRMAALAQPAAPPPPDVVCAGCHKHYEADVAFTFCPACGTSLVAHAVSVEVHAPSNGKEVQPTQ